jgi:hypothetical protein
MGIDFQQPGAQGNANGWTLPLSGRAVGRCCVDSAVTLRLDHPRGAFELRIEESFVFVTPGGVEVHMRPEEDPTGLGPILTVARTAVEQAIAFRDGRLEMSFADGSRLEVPGSEECEPWGLVDPDLGLSRRP